MKIRILFFVFGVSYCSAWSQLEIKNSNNNLLMQVTQTGGVAIGAAAPDAASKLDVQGKTKTQSLQIGTSTAGYVWTATDGLGNGGWAAAPSGADGVVNGGSVSGTTSKTLTLTRTIGSNVTIAFTDLINDADADPANETPLAGAGITVSGRTVTAVDQSITNETPLAGAGITVSGRTVSAVDQSASNEIQNLSQVLTVGNNATLQDILNVGHLAIGTTAMQTGAGLYINSSDAGIRTDHPDGSIMFLSALSNTNRLGSNGNWVFWLDFDKNNTGEYFEIRHDGANYGDAGVQIFAVYENGNVTTHPSGSLSVGTGGISTTGAISSASVSTGPLTVTSNAVNFTGLDNGTGNILYVSSGKIVKQSSSIRYKEKVSDLQDNFDAILQARPVSFTYKDSGVKNYGYIAEELEDLGLKNLVVYDNDGRPDGVSYEKVSVYLLEVVKSMKAEMEEMKKRLP